MRADGEVGTVLAMQMQLQHNLVSEYPAYESSSLRYHLASTRAIMPVIALAFQILA